MILLKYMIRELRSERVQKNDKWHSGALNNHRNWGILKMLKAIKISGIGFNEKEEFTLTCKNGVFYVESSSKDERVKFLFDFDKDSFIYNLKFAIEHLRVHSHSPWTHEMNLENAYFALTMSEIYKPNDKYGMYSASMYDGEMIIKTVGEVDTLPYVEGRIY